MTDYQKMLDRRMAEILFRVSRGSHGNDIIEAKAKAEIRELIGDCLDYVTPERVSGFNTVGTTVGGISMVDTESGRAEGKNQAIDELEAKRKELGV